MPKRKRITTRYYVASPGVSLENGGTAETDADTTSPDFWDVLDKQMGYTVDKAVEVNEYNNWVGFIFWR